MLRSLSLSLLFTSTAIAVGCGNTVDRADGGGGNGAQTSTGDDPCYPDSCTGPSGPAGPSSSSGGELACGEGGAFCPSGMFCDFGGDDCGQHPGFVADVCRLVPTRCEGPEVPTCGCDGHIHGSNCEANKVGADVASQGLCVPPQGQFVCGEHFCDSESEYCESFSEGAVSTHTCKPIPSTCDQQGEPDCDCVAAGADCPASCSTDGAGHFQVLCTI